uniref:Carboxypeptidase activation peptide domain-containing protein n=1 Tax=Tetranychus urticae TaxID=32264 RepID=T1KPC3_TETUR
MMTSLIELLFCLCVFLIWHISCDKTEESDAKIVKIHSKNLAEYEELIGLARKFQVDVWNRPSDANFTVWAAVDEDDEDFLKALDKIPIPFDILFENKAAYLALVNYTQPKLDLASDASSIKPVRPSLFKRYYRYTEYLSIIKSWADEFQSMYLISIGKSFEGRVIPAVVINRESQMDIASVDGDQDGDGDYDDDDVDGTDDSKISHQDGITGSHDRNRNRNNRQPNRRPPNNECKTVVMN